MIANRKKSVNLHPEIGTLIVKRMRFLSDNGVKTSL
jgi:hypothetical protein